MRANAGEFGVPGEDGRRCSEVQVPFLRRGMTGLWSGPFPRRLERTVEELGKRVLPLDKKPPVGRDRERQG